MNIHMKCIPGVFAKHFDVVVLTSEIFFDPNVQTAAGGLGVVNGTLLDELERNYDQHKCRALAVSVYPSHGYQKQIIYPENGGVMGVTYEKDPHPELTIDTGTRFKLMLAGRPCWIGVRIPAKKREHTAILLLDTDIEENNEHPDFRMITRVLYGEGHATEQLYEGGRWANINWLRILQAAVLGLGAYYALEDQQVWYRLVHMNESHSTFFQIHRLGKALGQALSFEDALAQVRKDVVFTNHTVLESGNKSYSVADIQAVAHEYAGFESDTLQKISGKVDYSFPMTDAALFLVGKGHANAVSEYHAEVANTVWPGYSIFPITNGVGPEYQHPEFRNMEKPSDIPELKRHFKELLYKNLKKRMRNAGWKGPIETPSLDAVLVTWARRCQEYKRPGLMWERAESDLVRTFLSWDHMAIVWGGYVHPDDSKMMHEWNKYWERFKDLPNTMPIFNYRLDLMQTLLKAGSDIWLNTPLFGHEACGTSWMSALLNCTLPISISDGGIRETPYYIPFGAKARGKWNPQYKSDAENLWQAIVPNLYKFRNRNPEIYSFLFEGMQDAMEHFSALSMTRSYVTFYRQVVEF